MNLCYVIGTLKISVIRVLYLHKDISGLCQQRSHDNCEAWKKKMFLI